MWGGVWRRSLQLLETNGLRPQMLMQFLQVFFPKKHASLSILKYKFLLKTCF